MSLTINIMDRESGAGPELLVEDQKFLMASAQKVLEVYRVYAGSSARADLRFQIETKIPIGAGLGSSAALCAALARKLNPLLQGEEWARACFEGEKIFHGTPSGVDPWTVTLGKPLAFRASDKQWKVLSLEKLHQHNCHFILWNSGEPHKTHEVIEQVGKLRDRTPLIYEDLMNALATNAEDMIIAFESGDKQRLGRLMNDSHFRLQQLGVSTDALEDRIEKMRSLGARGAKLTGAGCGGFAVGLFDFNDPEAKQRILESLPASEIKVIKV